MQKKPMQKMTNNVKGYTHAKVNESGEEMNNVEVQDLSNYSCEMATFPCTPQMKACFD